MSTTQEKILKPKLGLLELAKQLGNVSQACGYSKESCGNNKITFRS